MKRVASSRRHHVDLLRRRPPLDPAVVVDPPPSGATGRVDQLQALLRLVERGVLSAEEFERHQKMPSR